MKKSIYSLLCFNIKVMLLAFICFSPLVTFSQSFKPGSVEYLKGCNGLNSKLVLGADIRDLPGGNLSYLDGDSGVDADSCLRYEYKDDDLLAMGDSLNLDLIGIRTYKDKIVNIYLFFKRNDAYKVLNNFIASYGQFTDRPDNYSDIYDWNSSLLSLSLRYQYKVDLGIAIFSCKPLQNEIEADKIRATTLRQDYQALSLNN